MEKIGEELSSDDPELSAYFDHLVPLDHEAGELRLGLEKGHLFAVQLVDAGAVQKMQKATRAVLGENVKLTLVQNSEQANQQRTLSAQKARDRKARYLQAVEAVKTHPRVVEAARIFDAQIKNVTLPE
jgi:hypothetical protein